MENNSDAGNQNKLHRRKSIRLKGYDYSQAGLYFVTICTQNRACLFGHIHKNEMTLNDAGKMIETEWINLKNRFPNIEYHEFVIMPNHIHGILEIAHATTVGSPLVGAQNKMTFSDEIGQPQGIAENGQPQGIANIGQPQGIAPTANKTVGDIMDAFKSITTVEYIRGVKNCGWNPFVGKLWQRNYWEHIIRNNDDYQRISNYIINNTQNWDNDKLKP